MHYSHTTKPVILVILQEEQTLHGLSINMVTWAGSDVLIPSFLSLNTEIRI